MNIRNNELQTNVRIDNTGRISLFRALITDISCDLNMQKFPFDHVIYLRFSIVISLLFMNIFESVHSNELK